MNLYVTFIVVVVLVTCGVDGQGCDPISWPPELTVLEGSENGTLILQLSDRDDVQLVRYPSPDPPAFIAIDNGSLIFNATLDMDGDQALCRQLEENFFWKIFIQCNQSPDDTGIIVKLNQTDDFPPEFTGQFTKEIAEQSVIQTTITSITESDIMDRDCGDDTVLGSTTLFEIEDGNTDGAFAIPNVRWGTTVVNRLLDYENGDTHFVLNISVSDRYSPQRKSFTTLTVSIVDIDDNDPVFNHTSYLLRVKEQDSSSLHVWKETQPPVAVYDPDVDYKPVDPLVISLLDASSTVTVHNTTGQVRLERTFDRENEQVFTATLKVQQTQAAFRSSTATLTVEVEDINDNRPEFEPTVYDVSVLEHSAQGTSIALLSATDKDTGDNAIFNYTLVSQGAMFSIDTIQFGERQLGVLQVYNSSLLDRETSPSITVQVGTQEMTAEEGGDCSAGRCTATVSITLLDINDNSPVFNASTYDVTVDDNNIADVIVTVHATDDDEGENARVTYSLSSYDDSRTCNGVIIDADSGDVRVNGNLQVSQRCYYLVMACDNPLPPAQKRCTPVPLQIYFQASNSTIGVDAPVPANVLIPEKNTLQEEFSRILGVTVTIGIIEPRSQGSTVYMTAVNSNTKDPVPADHLQQLVDSKSGEINAVFNRYHLTAGSSADKDDFPPHVIALIVVAVVLLLALIVSIIIIARGHRSKQLHHRLIQRLSSTNEIYDNAGRIATKQETDSNDSIIELGDEDEEEDAIMDLGIINPIFQDDEDGKTLPKVTPRSDYDDGSLDKTDVLTGTGEGELKGRMPDTDSGVPSDRENGVSGESESDSSSKDATPVLARNDGQLPLDYHRGGSAYLAAVLASSGEPVPQGTVSEEDMVDVTSPEHLYHVQNSTGEEPPTKVDLTPSYVNVPNADVTSSSFSGNSSPAITVNHELPPMITEQQMMRQSDDDDDYRQEGRVPQRLPQQNDDDEDKEQNEDDLEGGSRLGLLVAQFTPPMRRSRSMDPKEEEEEEEEEVLPDEPEPDYAKKVRFIAQVTEITNDTSKGSDDTTRDPMGQTSTDNSGHPAEECESRPAETGTSASADEVENEDKPPTPFNVQEELTAF